MADINAANDLFSALWQATLGTFFGPIVVLTLMIVLVRGRVARIWGGAALALLLAWLAKEGLMSMARTMLSPRPMLSASLDGLVWGAAVAAGAALASGSRRIPLLSALCMLALVHSVSEILFRLTYGETTALELHFRALRAGIAMSVIILAGRLTLLRLPWRKTARRADTA